MDLLIKDLPEEVGRKIKALSVLTGKGIEEFRTLFADAITEKINNSLYEAIGGENPQRMVVQAPKMERTQESFNPAPSFVAGLGDVDDTPTPVKPPKGPQASAVPASGPEPEPDEDDDDFYSVGGPEPEDDMIEKDFGVVPEDMEDDDSLYADANASYSGKTAGNYQKVAASYTDPIPELSSEASQMNFFAKETGMPVSGGFAAAMNYRDNDAGGNRKPASLPAGEPHVDMSRGKRRGPKVSAAR